MEREKSVTNLAASILKQDPNTQKVKRKACLNRTTQSMCIFAGQNPFFPINGPMCKMMTNEKSCSVHPVSVTDAGESGSDED